ncbi:unnamed protein product [Spodoptera littoralis]|uniref:Uncharacterized protein n=1 Tax=Spodoptera littoralis TaxID=7109 RepID=A0A9P0IH03_SPOLI|nr:unnamed protein product [Spodoptera littoralis]
MISCTCRVQRAFQNTILPKLAKTLIILLWKPSCRGTDLVLTVLTVIARRAAVERAGAAAAAARSRRRLPGRGAHNSAARRGRRSKVRREIERAYVNIGTFTSERVHQSGALTQRCAGTSPVRFLRRPIEKCRMSFGSITRYGCVVRNAAAARLPPSSHRHCWYIYRLIIELVCVTIMKQLAEWQARSAGGGRAALPRLRWRVASQPHSAAAPPAHAQPSDFISTVDSQSAAHLLYHLKH